MCFEAQSTPNSKLLALDVSRNAVGVAISSPDMSIAIPLAVIKPNVQQNKKSELYKITRTVYSVLEIVHERRPIVGVIVGWPVDLSQQAGESCMYVQYFVDMLQGKLREIGHPLPLVLWDEFETSKMAKEKTVNTAFATKYVDHHAAAFILDSYMKTYFQT